MAAAVNRETLNRTRPGEPAFQAYSRSVSSLLGRGFFLLFGLFLLFPTLACLLGCRGSAKKGGILLLGREEGILKEVGV